MAETQSWWYWLLPVAILILVAHHPFGASALADQPDLIGLESSEVFGDVSLFGVTVHDEMPLLALGDPGTSGQDLSTTGASSGSGSSDADLATKLQNPIADLISLPFQFNWDKGVGPKDSDKFMVNIQPVIPISLNDDWNVVSRTILPVVYAESPANGVSSDWGIGDTTQSFFFTPVDPVNGWIIGFGPVAQIPTGTDDLFRNKQFSLGPTALILRQENGWTYGMLANHLWKVDGDDDYAEVNATFLQPFISFTTKSATTYGINTESIYDWTAEEWTIPINATISQLTKFGKQPVQLQLGGRYYAAAAPNGPEWGVRFGLTFLFPK